MTIRINDEFEAVAETVTITRVYLIRNGEVIVTTDGEPKVYDSIEEATDVAQHWDQHRMPSPEEINAMSDADIWGRIHRALGRR